MDAYAKHMHPCIPWTVLMRCADALLHHLPTLVQVCFTICELPVSGAKAADRSAKQRVAELAYITAHTQARGRSPCASCSLSDHASLSVSTH